MLAALWVLASQAYRFVVEQWPPLVAGIVGGAGAIGFTALLAALHWKSVSDETWTCPRPTGDGGEGKHGCVVPLDRGDERLASD